MEYPTTNPNEIENEQMEFTPTATISLDEWKQLKEAKAEYETRLKDYKQSVEAMLNEKDKVIKLLRSKKAVIQLSYGYGGNEYLLAPKGARYLKVVENEQARRKALEEEMASLKKVNMVLGEKVENLKKVIGRKDKFVADMELLCKSLAIIGGILLLISFCCFFSGFRITVF